MVKDDSSAGGLFSKMVQFVRTPLSQLSGLGDATPSKHGASRSKHHDDSIEPKGRNDLVRRREFDMLRRIRSGESVNSGLQREGGRDFSVFRSSMGSRNDERAKTLKKIDEIEAQMSRQWWRKVPRGADSEGANTSSRSFPPSSMPPGNPSRFKGDATSGKLSQFGPPSMLNPASQMGQGDSAFFRKGEANPSSFGASQDGSPAQSQFNRSDGLSGFPPSEIFSVKPAEVVHDPELEELAISFANGDDGDAESGLLAAIDANGARHQHEETWLALLDLYRATGRQEPFERVALDFSIKFGRSAPMWFSMPDAVGKLASVQYEVMEKPKKAHWKSPAVLDSQSIVSLKASLAKAAQPWILDWSDIELIEADAVVPMTLLLNSWAAQPVKLRMAGTAAVQAVLRRLTPSGDTNIDKAYWHLLMAYMRVVHRPDEFELAALDFCVTYDLSPPSWERAKCEFKAADVEGASGTINTIIGQTVHDSIMSEQLSGFATSMMAAQLATVELSGKITGDPEEILTKLQERVAGADVIVISCANLMRVDFLAAGSLLNWVTARQNEGRAVHFSDVNRMVAAFFGAIGISDHAEVTPRRD